MSLLFSHGFGCGVRCFFPSIEVCKCFQRGHKLPHPAGTAQWTRKQGGKQWLMGRYDAQMPPWAGRLSDRMVPGTWNTLTENERKAQCCPMLNSLCDGGRCWRALIHGVFWFFWCKYSIHDQFWTTSVTPSGSRYSWKCNNPPSWARISRVLHTLAALSMNNLERGRHQLNNILAYT